MGQIWKGKMTVCVSVGLKYEPWILKYETLILGFKTQLHLCRLSQLENPKEFWDDQMNVIEP